MAYRFRVDLGTFDRIPEAEALKLVDVWLMALSIQDEYWLRHVGAPELYQSGVIYRDEPDDIWSDVPAVLEDRSGDCEDFAAWRAAELRLRGFDAVPFARLESTSPVLYHALVRTPWGIEDPSVVLGMR